MSKQARDIQITPTVSLGGMKAVGEHELRKTLFLINIKRKEI